MPAPAPWLDDGLLPPRPDRSPAGWWGPDGPHEYDAAALPAAVRADDRGAIRYVWLPAHPRLMPLAAAALADGALAAAQAERDARVLGKTLLSQGVSALFLGGVAFLPVLVGGRLGMGLWVLAFAVGCADAAVGAGLDLRRLRRDLAGHLRRSAAEARYWLWAARSPPPRRTWALVAVLCAVHLVQLAVGERAYAAIALDHDAVRSGDWARLATSGLGHVAPMHLLFNALATLALGRVAETMVTARALLPVFALAVLGGSLASLVLDRGNALGASGGVCGLLGFLLAVAWRRRALLPPGFAAALLRTVGLLAVFGAVAWREIANGAHAGGLLTGVVLGALLVPPAGGLPLPATGGWRVLDLAALAAIAATAAMACVRMLAA